MSFPHETHGTRHFNLLEDLKSETINVELWTCEKSHLEPSRNAEEIRTFKQVKLFKGVSSRRNLLLRFINVIFFALQIIFTKKNNLTEKSVIIGSTPDPLSALGALILAKRLNLPFVLEVRDKWPETLIELQSYSSWHPYIMLTKAIDLFLQRNSDAFVSSLNGFQNSLIQEAKSKPFVWVPNYSKICFEKTSFDHKNKAKKISLIYTGTIGRANDLKTLIEAMKIIDNQPICGTEIHLDVYGDGTEKAELETKAKKLKNVSFHGRVSRTALKRLLPAADFGVICWKSADLYQLGISANKISDYLSAGLPVLMCSDFPHLIGQKNAGYLVPSEAPEKLSELIATTISQLTNEQLLQLKKNAKNLSEEYYSFASFSKQLVKMLKNL